MIYNWFRTLIYPSIYVVNWSQLFLKNAILSIKLLEIDHKVLISPQTSINAYQWCFQENIFTRIKHISSSSFIICFSCIFIIYLYHFYANLSILFSKINHKLQSIFHSYRNGSFITIYAFLWVQHKFHTELILFLQK